MKKILLFIAFIFTCNLVTSQIDAGSVIGLPTAQNNTEMNNITGATEGSFLYNVAEKNIYFFNGTSWTAPTNSFTNIYSSNGTLLGPRTLNGGGNSLVFNNLNVLQFFSNGATQLFATGALQLGSTGNSTQISGALGLTLTATSNGITLNGNTVLNNNLRVVGSFSDSSSNAGTTGQVLSSTGTGTQWVDPNLAEIINKTASYTLTSVDNGKVFTFNSATDVTLNVPAGLPVGFNISIYQINTGKIEIAGAGGVTVLNRLSRFKTAGKDAGAGLLCTSTNNFHLTGDLKR
ncbi:hypothetical protein [Tenacibaculum halocynthiae]|uniref:hypothetical protein n=1 Tax=Tenacibaculum halocynthiae TaxID=1254437 RepID=UPI003D64E8EB